MSRAKGFGEFKRGWPILLAAILGVGLGLSPVPFYTTGAIAPHLAKEFGWRMGEIFFSLTMLTLVTLFAAPLAGVLAQRLGCLLYTSPSPRDRSVSRMPSSA